MYLQDSLYKIHYTQFGEGPEIWLAFHGFGQLAQTFEGLSQHMTNYTVYALDLLYHGKSEWENCEEPLQTVHWQKLIASFLKEKNISKFSLIGYSLGARLCWALLPSFADKIEKIEVLAPDGLFKSSWYHWATSKLFRSAFRKLCKQGKIPVLIQVLHILRVINTPRVQLLEKFVEDRNKSSQLYATWMVYRKLFVKRRTIIQIIKAHPIELSCFLAGKDTIIPSQKIARLFKRRLKKTQVVFFPVPHQHLMEPFLFYSKNQNRLKHQTLT